MDMTLIFSHSCRVICCNFINIDLLLLVCDRQLAVFNVGHAKLVHSLPHAHQQMPIASWVLNQQKQSINDSDNVKIVLQNKNGINSVYKWSYPLMRVQYVSRYATAVMGFCKMANIRDKFVVGVSQENRAIMIYNISTGQQIYKVVLDQDQKAYDSIACMQVLTNTNQNNNFTVYLAQQGYTIFKIQIDITAEVEEIGLEASQKLAIEVDSKQQIKIINCMKIVNKSLFAVVRKSPYLYILSLQPALLMSHKIELGLANPRNLISITSKVENLIKFVCSDGNKTYCLSYYVQAKQANSQAQHKRLSIKQLLQIKQSKNIEYLEVIKEVICGCTLQNQFFYAEIQ